MSNITTHKHIGKNGVEYTHTHAHGDGDSHVNGSEHERFHPNSKAVSNRLARAIGHLEKVKQMVDNGEDCTQILIQLAAVKSAINNAGKVILIDHMNHCIVEAVENGENDAITDLEEAILKFIK